MKQLILAQHNNRTLHSSTSNIVSAAQQIGADITVLVAGYQCAEVAAQAAQVDGVTQVLLADHLCYEAQLAENVAALVVDIAEPYSYVLGPANSFGKNLLPRVGALLDVQPIADVIKIESAEVFHRPIYAGNLVARVRSHDTVKVLTVRTTAFAAAAQQSEACGIESLTSVHDLALSRRISVELTKSERPELESARVVVAGGRALGSSENFELLYTLADQLGGAVGASRAAVDAGYVANELQVGQTGRVVAPELYIAVGISGAIQHIAGMKDAQVVVAINKDPDAAIFAVADYGLVADLFEALPLLQAHLAETEAQVAEVSAA